MIRGTKYRLGDICDFQGGAQPPKDEWINTPKQGYVRMLQIRDFTKSRDFAVEYVKCSNKLRYCKEDDILIGRYGASVGKILTGLEGAYNVAIIRSVPKENIVSKEYIRRYFEAPSFQQRLQKVCSQRTAQAGFSKEDIVDLPIVVPSLAEQQNIVDVLDAEFAKIDALKANAEKNLQNAKDLLAEVFKKELASRQGWTKMTLAEACDKITDGTHNSPPNLKSGHYKYITAKNIKPYGIDLSDITYVEDSIHKEIYSRCDPVKGDVLFIKDGATTGIAIVNPLEEEFSLLSSVALLKPRKDTVTSEFLCYVMNSPQMYGFVREQMDGAAITRVTLKKIKSFTIAVPPISEQTSLVARLTSINDRCKALQENYTRTLALCDDLKQALLRKAFAGAL